MFKKLIQPLVSVFGTSETLIYAGAGGLIGGYFYYSVNNLWDWKAQAAIYGGAGLLILWILLNLRQLQSALTSRRGRHGATAGASTVLVVAIVCLLSFLNSRHNRRIDLTENQLYSLSNQSRKVVESLEGEIQVVGFFQDEVQSRVFEELMQQYRYVSARVDYEVVDPQQEPSRAARFNVERFGQVAVAGGVKTEIVDDFNEARITNAIIKVTREGQKIVYFLTGHGERSLEEAGPDGLSQAKEAIEKQNYLVRSYNLAQENALPENPAVLISAGPTVSFLPNEVRLLKEYLEGGGKLFLMLDPRTRFSMDDLLGEYGLGVDGNVVIDASGVGQLFGLGVAAPIVSSYETHAITDELRGVMTFFPMAQSVQVTDSSLGYNSSKLFSTSARSWGETDLEGDQAAFDEGKDIQGPLALAAVAVKTVQPGGEPGDEPSSHHGEGGDEDRAGETAPEPVPQAGAEDGGESDSESRESRIVLVGDSDFATNAYSTTSANGDFLRMTVSWLAEDSDLVAVQSRDQENRRVNLTRSESTLMFWATVILMPLVTLVLGMAVWLRRK